MGGWEMPAGQGWGWSCGSLSWAQPGITGTDGECREHRCSSSLSPSLSLRRCWERDKVATQSRSFSMAETSTTDFSLIYTTSGYLNSSGNNMDMCLTLSYESLVFLGVCTGISLFGVVTNGIVIWFLFSHTRNPFTVYILNLAVADFSLLLLLFLLMSAFLSLTICSLFNHIMFSYRVLEIILGFLCHFFDLSSLGLLTAISVDRCVSVFFPIWYRCYRPRHLSGIVSGLLWAFAGAFVSSMYLSFHFRVTYEEVFGGIGIAIIVTLSSVMLISNLSLFIKLRCGFQRRHPGKLYCCCPAQCHLLLCPCYSFQCRGIPLIFRLQRNYFLTWYFLLLALLNSSTNPIVYFLVGNCQQLFQCVTPLLVKNLFPISILNLPCRSLTPFPLVLSLVTRENRSVPAPPLPLVRKL
uniref:G-protein coupled receptors family 1 profile domain-containing protein n=1 Tax=Anas platyrhynchos TaxID=8839 RepID=A0A8B9SGK1_ANAPL